MGHQFEIFIVSQMSKYTFSEQIFSFLFFFFCKDISDISKNNNNENTTANDNRLKSIIITLCITRVIKNLLKCKLRTSSATSSSASHNNEIVSFFNMVFGKSQLSDTFWKLEIKVYMNLKYGRYATFQTEETHPDFDFRSKVNKLALFEALQQQSGINFSHKIFKSFAKNLQQFEVELPLKETDLVSIDCKVKCNPLSPDLWKEVRMYYLSSPSRNNYLACFKLVETYLENYSKNFEFAVLKVEFAFFLSDFRISSQKLTMPTISGSPQLRSSGVVTTPLTSSGVVTTSLTSSGVMVTPLSRTSTTAASFGTASVVYEVGNSSEETKKEIKTNIENAIQILEDCGQVPLEVLVVCLAKFALIYQKVFKEADRAQGLLKLALDWLEQFFGNRFQENVGMHPYAIFLTDQLSQIANQTGHIEEWESFSKFLVSLLKIFGPQDSNSKTCFLNDHKNIFNFFFLYPFLSSNVGINYVGYNERIWHLCQVQISSKKNQCRICQSSHHLKGAKIVTIFFSHSYFQFFVFFFCIDISI